MEAAATTASGSAVDPEPLTVLVVDDDPPIAEGLSEFLEDEGYNVVVAGDGRAALDELRRGLRPCAIVLDLMMPVMDGWDFRHEQLKDPELSEIPVIVVTATGFSEESVKVQLGAVEVVPKPPSLEHLLAAIRRCCGEPHH
jgi:CheY-like chemotaxis protein